MVLIAFASAAILVVIAVVIISRIAGGPSADGDEGQDAGAVPTELSGLATISAPETAPASVDWAGNPVSYDTTNLADGDPSTAWRMEGDGTGHELTIEFDEVRTLSEVGLINGYAKVDEERENYNWYEINRRVMQVTWVFDDGTEVPQELHEVAELQTTPLDTPVQTQSIRLRLDEVSSPGERDYTAVSELTIIGN
jgi:hypothetical protein